LYNLKKQLKNYEYMAYEGWIKLHRQIMENPLYFSEPFTRCHAWIDLLLIANFKEGYFFKRGIKVEVKRGQIGYDLDSLAKRWRWSRGKVERFISVLENDAQIVRQKNNVCTLISIVNYETYQASDKAKDNPNDTADGHQIVKQTEANKKNNKKYNTPPNPQKGEVCVSIDFDILGRIFNEISELVSVTLPLSASRKKLVTERVEEHGKIVVNEMLQTVKNCPYLLGENDKGWRASFNWLFQSVNFVKVVEGTYRPTASKTVSKTVTGEERSRIIEKARQKFQAELNASIAERSKNSVSPDDLKAKGLNLSVLV